ncbi:MAG: 4Fe-4S dicluster domain-containing protein [Bacilli bacterium]
MSARKLNQEVFRSWVNELIARRRMVGVRAKEERFVFGPLAKAEDLRLDYDVTLLPPKKYFLPPREDLLTFTTQGEYASRVEDEPFILFGVHPYDVAAISQLDAVFGAGHYDVHYMTRRRNATIVACDVQTASAHVFASAMNTATVQDGFDLLLTKIGDDYLADARTDKGEALLAVVPGGSEPTHADFAKREQVWRRNRESLNRHELKCRPEDLPTLLENSYDDPLWEERARLCFSCGSCNLVCPTCYCFDVRDDLNWDMQTGTRTRACDACLLNEFAAVAGGHNFREKAAERYRHRFYRKGSYLPHKFGFVACVGCGRCISACVAGIANPVDIYNQLFANYHPETNTPEPTAFPEASSVTEQKESRVNDRVLESTVQPKTALLPNETLLPLRTHSEDIHAPRASDLLETELFPEETPLEDIYAPQTATLVQARPLTELETFYEVRLDSDDDLGHGPGQFVEISLPGFGEAPISVSSSPTQAGTFQMVVRNAGNLTNALGRLTVGDRIGVRGPFGSEFPVHGVMKGKDILLICGGIGLVPVRSAINFVLDNREDYGHMTILYGAKTPGERLFADEQQDWSKRDRVTVLETVDEPDASWHGHVGRITALLPLVRVVPANTIAVVCGPPVMYRFVLKELNTMGLADASIYLSLERRMKCGVGKCGHCQMNGVYVCQEGPVFQYSTIREVMEAI